MRLRLVAIATVACALAVPGIGHASNHALRVWPVGDSITLGSSWPQSVPGGYRTDLDEILSRDGYTHQFVGTSTLNPSPSLSADGQTAHDGHGGFRIDQVFRDLTGLAHTRTDFGGHWLTGTRARHAIAPDVALIHLGTNDILQDWDTRRFPTRDQRADLTNAGDRTIFVADMTQRLFQLVARIHTLRPKCRLVIATAVPIASQPYAAVTSAYAASVRHLVLELETHHYPVTLVDAYAAFTVSEAPGSPVAPGLLTRDGVHPTVAGYFMLARLFAAALTG